VEPVDGALLAPSKDRWETRFLRFPRICQDPQACCVAVQRFARDASAWVPAFRLRRSPRRVDFAIPAGVTTGPAAEVRARGTTPGPSGSSWCCPAMFPPHSYRDPLALSSPPAAGGRVAAGRLPAVQLPALWPAGAPLREMRSREPLLSGAVRFRAPRGVAAASGRALPEHASWGPQARRAPARLPLAAPPESDASRLPLRDLLWQRGAIEARPTP